MLKEMTILYAKEFIHSNTNESVPDNSDVVDTSKQVATREQTKESLLTESKALAMKESLASFYSKYEGQSWKNIITLGDAHFEHDAIKQVVLERPDQDKRCRLKRIKMVEGPTLQ